MSGERFAAGTIIPLKILVLDQGGVRVTGLTPAILIRRDSDDEFWDGAGAYQATDPSLTMTEDDAAEAPGWYTYLLDTGDGSGATQTSHSWEAAPAGSNNGPFVGSVNVGDGYNGFLWFDSVDGTTGAVVDTNGTMNNPVSDEADLRTLSAATGIRRIRVTGILTLGATYTRYEFHPGAGPASISAIVRLNDQTVNAAFYNVRIQQALTGGRIAAYECDVAAGFGGTGDFYHCAVGGTHLLLDGSQTNYLGCYGREISNFWSVSFFGSAGGATKVVIWGFEGEVGISDLGRFGAGDTVDLSMRGLLDFDALCIAGTVTLAGSGKITNLGSGFTLDQTAFIDTQDVIAAQEALVGRIEIDTTTNPWRENHYDLATRTSIERAFELFDDAGVAIAGDATVGNNPLFDASVLVARKVLV